MNFRIFFIAFWVLLGLAILFLALIPDWRPFCVFFSVLGVILSVFFTAYQVLKLKKLDTILEGQRYEDAYLYADKNNTDFNTKEFKYSKRDEKSIKRVRGNIKLLIYTGIILILFMIFLTIIFTNNYILK